jgi:hypothetical protein
MADPFSSKEWKNLPQEYQNLLEGLSTQWEALVGFSIPVSHGMLLDMARHGVLTLWDFGHYMGGDSRVSPGGAMPWAYYGLDKDAFQSAVLDYSQVYQDLTGQTPGKDLLAVALGQRYTGTEWRTFLQQDASLQKTYGWLKLGYNFQQFQSAKVGMQESLGYVPSDQQAVLQLQYSQAGHNSAAAAIAPATTPQALAPRLPSMGTAITR